MFHWSDIEDIFRCESVIYYCCGGGMYDGAIANGILNSVAVDAIMVN